MPRQRTQPKAATDFTSPSTQALPETVAALGGVAIPCPVGYVFVHETMRSTGAIGISTRLPFWKKTYRLFGRLKVDNQDAEDAHS